MSDDKKIPAGTTPAPGMADKPLGPERPPVEQKPTKPAPAKRTVKRGGTLRQRFDSLVQPQIVSTAELPEWAELIRATGDEALIAAFGLDRIIPAGLITADEAVDLVRVHEHVADLADQIKP